MKRKVNKEFVDLEKPGVVQSAFFGRRRNSWEYEGHSQTKLEYEKGRKLDVMEAIEQHRMVNLIKE